jgi:peptide chain release factor 1
MNERLSSLLKRYDELTLLIQDPSLVKDQNRYRDVMKEHSHLDEIAVLHNSVEELEKQVNDTKTLIQEEKDQEMRELAREELKELENKLLVNSDKLKFLLIPRDPLDEKNIIMEIRAGTGGEEAALFAADLYRMYSRFAETKGWKF